MPDQPEDPDYVAEAESGEPIGDDMPEAAAPGAPEEAPAPVDTVPVNPVQEAEQPPVTVHEKGSFHVEEHNGQWHVYRALNDKTLIDSTYTVDTGGLIEAKERCDYLSDRFDKHGSIDAPATGG